MIERKRFKVWESIIVDEYFPGSFDGEIVKIYKEGIGVKTHNGVVVLTVIQPEGKARMNAKDYLNGLKESLVGKVIG